MMYQVKFTMIFPTFLIAILAGQYMGQTSESEKTIKKVEDHLGSQIIRGELFFEINDKFVAKIDFDRLGKIQVITVFPRTYLSRCDADWDEPRSISKLTHSEYNNVLSKIDQIRPLGPLTVKGAYGPILNSLSEAIDQYQNGATVRYSTLSTDTRGIQTDLTRSFSIMYFHTVEGVVEKKFSLERLHLGEIYKAKIDGSWYVVREWEFNRLSPETRQSTVAAGPIPEDTTISCN